MQGKLRRLSNVWTLTGFQMAQTCCAEGSKYFMVFILSVFTSSQVFWDSKSHHCVTNQTPVITHLDESPDWARSMTSPTGFNKLSVRAQGCKPHSSSHLSSLSLNMWKNSSTILQQFLYRFSQQIYAGESPVSSARSESPAEEPHLIIHCQYHKITVLQKEMKTPSFR